MRQRNYIVILATVLAGAVATVVLFRSATPAQSNGPSAHSNDTARSSVLSGLAQTSVTVATQGDILDHLRETVVSARIEGTSASDFDTAQIDNALVHASEAIWRRFYQSDPEVYREWRVRARYQTPSDERAVAAGLRFDAGLKASDPAPDDWFIAIWSKWISSVPRPSGLSGVPGATQILAGTLHEALPVDPLLGHTRAFPSLVQQQSTNEVSRALATGQLGAGWPFWLPPSDVLARLARPGTKLVEVRFIPVFVEPSRSVGAMSLMLARDELTGSWWIVQFWIYDLETSVKAGLNGHLL